ncbi:hypothetical protein Bca4012_011531 [Brassica carinata]
MISKGSQLDLLLSYVKIEGNMRQATDVEHRDLEYEQGRTVFTPTEDAQDIADCLKYFLRESEKFPSSPGLHFWVRVLAFGSKGIPYCMTNTQVMFHQPLGTAGDKV